MVVAFTNPEAFLHHEWRYAICENCRKPFRQGVDCPCAHSTLDNYNTGCNGLACGNCQPTEFTIQLHRVTNVELVEYPCEIYGLDHNGLAQ